MANRQQQQIAVPPNGRHLHRRALPYPPPANFQGPGERAMVLIKPSGAEKALQMLARIQPLTTGGFIASGRLPAAVIEGHLDWQPPNLHDQIRAHLGEGTVWVAVFDGPAGMVERIRYLKYDIRAKENKRRRDAHLPVDDIRNYIHSSDNVWQAMFEIENMIPWIREQIR